MPDIAVYHSPNFLEYRGDPNQIILPARPVATVAVDQSGDPISLLEQAYACTQHAARSWYNNPNVKPLLRSTSPGDLLELDGRLWVVDSFSFTPYRPNVTEPAQKLAQAHRLLQEAVDANDSRAMQRLANDALHALHYALAADNHAATPAVKWPEAKPGDTVSDDGRHRFVVIARKMKPKAKARFLAKQTGGEVWIDTPTTWAVLKPVSEE